jgi:hypothetical protein
MTTQNTTISNKATATGRVIRMLDLDIDWWNTIRIYSAGIAAVAAVITFIAMYTTTQLAKKEAKEAKNAFAIYKLTVEGQVADAKMEGIEAGKTAGNALVRAAELEKEAALLKADNLRLEAIIAPRSLTLEQQAKLAAALKPFAGAKVIIASPPMDGEAQGIALQIKASLEGAGLVPVNMIGRIGHVAGVALGIHMTGRAGGNNAELMTKLHDELSSSGQFVVASEGNAAQPLLTYPGGDFPDAKSAAVAIFIGAKPVPIMK